MPTTLDRERILQTAQGHLDRRDYVGAIRQYEKLSQLDPNDQRTLLKIGDLQARTQAYAEAIATYDRVGRFYAEQGFPLKAIAVFKQIRELIKKHTPELEHSYAHIVPNLARIYTELGLVSDALAAYDEVATRHQRAGRDHDAIEVFRQMTAIDASNPLPHLRLAEACSRVNAIDDAISSFWTAAELLLVLERRDDALKVIERMLHFRHDTRYAKRAAELYLERGNREDGLQALGKLQSCFQTDPKNLEILELLRRAFMAIGQPAKASEVQGEINRIAAERGQPPDGTAPPSPNRPLLVVPAESVPISPRIASDEKGVESVVTRLQDIARDYSSSERLRPVVEARFPPPIAAAYHSLRSQKSELSSLLQTIHAIVRHLALVALAEYTATGHRDAELSDAVIRLLDQEKKADGTWLHEICALVTRHLNEQTHDFGLFHIFEARVRGEVTNVFRYAAEVVTERNRAVHPQSLADPVPALRRKVDSLLLQMELLEDAPILVPLSHSASEDGSRTHTCVTAMGQDELFRREPVRTDVDLVAGAPHLLIGDALRFLRLSPFYVYALCERNDCDETHLFALEGVHKNNAKYVSPRGHVLSRPGDGILDLLREPQVGAMPALVQARRIDAYARTGGLPVGHRLADYRIVAPLSSPRMTTVYEAEHVTTGQHVALKVLSSPELRDRFMGEARRLRTINSEHVVRFLEFHPGPHEPTLVMELATGWLEAGQLCRDAGQLPKPVPLQQALRIIVDACLGLETLHKLKIVHRDVKPANLLLFDGGTCKLGDLGIALSRSDVRRTTVGITPGTQLYMSPEQAAGEEVKATSDLYSLGLVLYELLSGAPPFGNKLRDVELAKLSHRTPDPLSSVAPNIPSDVCAVTMRCLAPDPDARLGSARELFRALLPHLGDAPR